MSVRGRNGRKSEPRYSSTWYAEALERLEVGCGVASCGGESRWRAGAQLGSGEALDDAHPAAAAGTELQPVRAGSSSGSTIVREGWTRAISRRHNGNKAPRLEFVKKP